MAHEQFALAESRLGLDRYVAEGRWRVVEFDGGAVAEPVARHGVQQSQRVGHAIVVGIPILHEEMPQCP